MNLTSLQGQIVSLDHAPMRGAAARLILNARAQMPAADPAGQARTVSIEAFRRLTPGGPLPAYRYCKPKEMA